MAHVKRVKRFVVSDADSEIAWGLPVVLILAAYVAIHWTLWATVNGRSAFHLTWSAR